MGDGQFCGQHNKEIEGLKEEMKDTSKALTVVTLGVENINKSLNILVTSNRELSEAMIKHYATQEQILKDLSDDKKEIAEIKKTQVHGCQAVQNAVQVRKLETDAMRKDIESLITASKKSREEIDYNNKQIGILIEQVKVANNRIKDCETGIVKLGGKIDTNLENFNKWKETIYKVLIGKGFAIIVLLIATIYGFIK